MRSTTNLIFFLQDDEGSIQKKAYKVLSLILKVLKSFLVAYCYFYLH